MKTSGPRQEFVDWLAGVLDSSGLPIKTFAAKAGVGQSSISQILSGKRGVSQEMVEKVSRAATADSTHYNRVLSEGLLAAGFAPADGEITYQLDPSVARVVEAWNGAGEEGKRLIESTAEMVIRAESKGAVGARPIDDPAWDRQQEEGRTRLQEELRKDQEKNRDGA